MNEISTGNAETTKFWLALLRTPGLGSRTLIKLLDRCSPPQLFAESSASLTALGLKERSVQALRHPDWDRVEQDLAWLEHPDSGLITFTDAAYPPLLKAIADPPPALFIRGNPALLSTPQIAVVGSRNPSSLGTQTAEDFAKTLARQGFTITSGLALGIDAASHWGALKAQGATIAVAGTGLDRIYPARHQELARKIVATGAMVSEFPPGTPAKANHFPRRNRIISGLSIGLLVVEAAKQSGSLITARLALDQGREVFAIPGSIHNPLARGCNALIREGAKLVETTQDILEEFNHYNQEHETILPANDQTTLDLEQQKLLNLIMFSPTSVDTLVKETDLSVEVIASMLLVLELNGYIAAGAGGGYIRIK